jgi:hypothetical protein
MEKKQNTVKGEATPEQKQAIAETIQAPQPQTPEQIKKNLEEQIQKYNRLNRLVKDREIFESKKEQLNKYLDDIKKEITNSDLETKVCKMTLSEPYSNRSEGIVISNVFVIEKAIRFIVEEIGEKVRVIENNILAIS